MNSVLSFVFFFSECVPSVVASAIRDAISIPTIGIGSGPHCDGQVLVYHDLLGMLQHEHHAKVSPSFCKTYGQIGKHIQSALDQYKSEVENKVFPGTEFDSYKMTGDEEQKFKAELQKQLEQKQPKERERTSYEIDSETIKVYWSQKCFIGSLVYYIYIVVELNYCCSFIVDNSI